HIIRGRPVPLVIYVFTGSEDTKYKFLQSTSSGTVVLNDTLLILGNAFGGQGESAYGSYLGKFSFDTFQIATAASTSLAAEPFFQQGFPSYTKDR
ncbi:hypothetical protein B0H11DRAFT_2283649, partial [Mycena galericulata]